MQKMVPEKQTGTQKARKGGQKQSAAAADKAFVLAMEAPFFRTAFAQQYREAFKVTHAAAKAAFERLLESGCIEQADDARHFRKGPAFHKQETLVRLVGNRTGDFKFKDLLKEPDKIVEGVKCVNQASGLLPGDVIFGSYKRSYGTVEFFPEILVQRTLAEVVCGGISLAKNFGFVEGCNSTVKLERSPENRGEPKSRQFFTVKLDDACLQPFSNIEPLTGRIARIIGGTDDTQGEIDMTLARLGIPSAFSDEAMQQAASLPDVVDSDREVRERVDLRDIGFVTIDGEDARDFDDAVWCKPAAGGGWRLLVAIADVSHYVRPQSPLDADAQQRCTSVYFPTRVVPMLPEKLSNGLCSLNPGVDRCTLVCDMLVSAEGVVTAYQFYPALICSKARLTYTSVWAALNGDAADFLVRGGNLTDINNLYALFKALLAQRKKRGAADFATSETEIVTDGQTQKIIAIRKREHNDAHRLIEECMLAANVCAADFVSLNKAQCLYRVHKEPDGARLRSVSDVLKAFGLTLSEKGKPTAADYARVSEEASQLSAAEVINMMLLRSMQRACYSNVKGRHFGLNYDAYTHFTSPIRRYPDLLVHRTIRAILEGGRYEPVLCAEPSEAMLVRMSELLSQEKKKGAQEKRQKTPAKNSAAVWEVLGLLTSSAERRADEAARDVVAWMKADFMSSYTGKAFDGVITGANPAGVYVTLTGFFVEGFVHVSRLGGNDYFHYDEQAMRFEGAYSRQCFNIGDKVQVRVHEVDTGTRRIDFTMLVDYTSRQRKKSSKKSRKRFA